MSEKKFTECQLQIKRLREQSGMNRKEFCEYFKIPYRTVTEWERGTRNAPEYVLRLLAYYLRMESKGIGSSDDSGYYGAIQKFDHTGKGNKGS